MTVSTVDRIAVFRTALIDYSRKQFKRGEWLTSVSIRTDLFTNSYFISFDIPSVSIVQLNDLVAFAANKSGLSESVNSTSLHISTDNRIMIQIEIEI